jgi:hypothetical protein
MKSLCLGLGLSAAVLLGMSSAWAEMPRTAAPEGAAVYFISPTDGATVDQTFTVKFGLKGMGVAPAGIDVPETGHHHLLIDTETLPDMSQTLPATDSIRHFGKGQTETELTLAPGKHTLQLLLGDKNHVPHNPPVLSEKISVTVK